MKWLDKKKHKSLEEKYDHYICDICAQIGVGMVIKDLQELHEDYLVYPDGECMLEDIKKLIKKWG